MPQHWTLRGSWVTEKASWPNRRKAEQAMESTCERNGWPVGQYRAYRCRDCNRYHFGRVSGKQRFN